MSPVNPSTPDDAEKPTERGNGERGNGERGNGERGEAGSNADEGVGERPKPGPAGTPLGNRERGNGERGNGERGNGDRSTGDA